MCIKQMGLAPSELLLELKYLCRSCMLYTSKIVEILNIGPKYLDYDHLKLFVRILKISGR
jgi:hypothetical protein